MDLLDIRNKIDELDKDIVGLFEERMKLCKNVADYKISVGKEVLDRQREQQKLDNLQEIANGEFNKRAVEELFMQIMSISRKLQYRLLIDHGINEDLGFMMIEELEKETVKVVYQGVPGAYSHEGMLQYFGAGVDYFNVKTFRDVMVAIQEKRADYAILPIENSTAGIVNDTYDLLVEYNNYIVDEVDVKVSHALLGLPEAAEEDIKVVYSHPQGLMQCSKFLEERKEWQQIAQPNTAGSALKVINEKDKTQAAIASPNNAEIYGLKILKENINLNDINTTRFIIISNKNIYREKAEKISICFEIPHESGSLYNMLSHFIYNNINMTKIESRPLEDKNWEYRFFVEFEGRLDQAAVKNALTGIKKEAASLKILGNY